MFTLRDVLEVRNTVVGHIELFGAEDGFKEEFGKRFEDVGLAFREELGVSQAEANRLPFSTKLGAKAGARFSSLKEWLETQDKNLDPSRTKRVRARV